MASSLNLAPSGVILYALFDRIIDFTSLPSWTELDFLGLGAKYVFQSLNPKFFENDMLARKYLNVTSIRGV